MFKQNENWTHEFETIFGGKYTMYFTKNGDDWVFGLYDGSKCIGEKKCHQWHEPDNFVYFTETCIMHPDDSNVDCAYLAEHDYKIKVEKTCDNPTIHPNKMAEYIHHLAQLTELNSIPAI